MVLASGKEDSVVIDGPAGMLEARVASAGALADAAAVAVVCHPHSLFGGSLQNKVVHTLCRSFRELGVASLRFNFRGVGRSEGAYDAGLGETDDVLAAVEWLQARAPGRPLWLAGFSFGAYVAARAARCLADAGQAPAQLVLVAPSVDNFPMDELLPLPRPLLVAWGDADEVVDPASIAAWAARLQPPARTERFADIGHFFHGALPELKDRLVAALSPAGA